MLSCRYCCPRATLPSAGSERLPPGPQLALLQGRGCFLTNRPSKHQLFQRLRHPSACLSVKCPSAPASHPLPRPACPPPHHLPLRVYHFLPIPRLTRTRTPAHTPQPPTLRRRVPAVAHSPLLSAAAFPLAWPAAKNPELAHDLPPASTPVNRKCCLLLSLRLTAEICPPNTDTATASPSIPLVSNPLALYALLSHCCPSESGRETRAAPQAHETPGKPRRLQLPRPGELPVFQPAARRACSFRRPPLDL